MKIRHEHSGYFGPAPHNLTSLDREAVEGFTFFLSVAGKPDEQDAPYRHLARYWYEGLLTPAEGRRIREEESEKRTKIESAGEA